MVSAAVSLPPKMKQPMRYHLNKIYLICILLTIFNVPLLANEPTQGIASDTTTRKGDELTAVTVAGKSEARKQQEQAYAIAVLNLRQTYNTTAPLNKVLNTVSSVRIREDGGVGSNYNFSLNGFSGNQVKLFLDGIPMDNFGSSFNLGNISANMADRIEVYKGVIPVSLGADALGGAVNIISRKDLNYLDASYSIGSFNTHKFSVNGAHTNLRTGFTVRANAFYNYSDNNYKVFVPVEDLSTNKKGAPQWVRRFHDKYRSEGVRIETGVTKKSYADYLLAGVILSENHNDVQTGATMDAVYGGVRSKSSSIVPSVRWGKENLFVDGLSASVYGAYSMVDSFTTDTLSRKYNWLGEWVPSAAKGEKTHTDSKIKHNEWLLNANLNYVIDSYNSINLNHVFSSMDRKIHDKVDPDNESNKIPQKLSKNVTGLGWMFKYRQFNANVFGKSYNTTSSTYKILDEYTNDRRLAKIEDSKNYWGYGAATAYHIFRVLQLKLSYEKAYRLPESTEMFGDGLIQQRNPNLKAENSKNLNLGLVYDQQVREHDFFIEANFIYRNTQDFILKEAILTSNPTSGYVNLGKVLTKGVEGSVRYGWKNMFHAGVGLTFQDITDAQQFETNTESMVGEGISENIRYKERVPNIPYFFGHGNLGLRFRNVGMKGSELMVDYLANYVQKYYLSFPGLGASSSKKVIPEQLSHDIALSYSIKNGKYNVSAECANLTGEKLYDNYRLQKPGRTFTLKIRYFLK